MISKNATIARKIKSIVSRNPDKPYAKVAEQVRRTVRGAHTTPKSVAATVHSLRQAGDLATAGAVIAANATRAQKRTRARA